MASVKTGPKRRKSSSARTLIGKIEIAEESSTEIVVNSTSILSLSEEAAQLTVKNGSIESSQSGNSSKSSDEVSITYRNLDTLNSLPECGKSISTKVAHENDSADQNSLDSDDTSYAKAINQMEVTEVDMPPESQMHLCHSHRAHMCHSAHHTCCHHHHHHPHHVQHEHCHVQAPVPVTVAAQTHNHDTAQALHRTYAQFAHIYLKGRQNVSAPIARTSDQLTFPSQNPTSFRQEREGHRVLEDSCKGSTTNGHLFSY